VNLRGFSGELKSALEQVTPAVERGLPLLPEEKKSAASTAFHVDIPESLEFIANSVHRMDHLIAAILNLSRIGHRALEPERLNVNDVVHGTLETLAFQISQHGVSVTVGNLPEIVADRTALEQIFANLLANAINYLDPNRPGEIHVDGQHLCHETVFRVRDNGVGVSADHLESIFQVFQRAGSHDVPGEGMGLAYVRTLVRRHGGRIWCESQPGEGSTFIFTVSDHVLEETVIVPEGRPTGV
jgi:signal transduction histidine kinase